MDDFTHDVERKKDTMEIEWKKTGKKTRSLSFRSGFMGHSLDLSREYLSYQAD